MVKRPAVAVALSLLLAGWRGHPIHAARVELDIALDGRIAAIVHVYQADFPPGLAPAAVAGYLDRTLVLTDAKGARIPLRPTTVSTEGDRVRIALAGQVPTGPLQGRVLVSVLQERFSDQVDVVDARVQGRRAQMVFLRGDKPQPLP